MKNLMKDKPESITLLKSLLIEGFNPYCVCCVSHNEIIEKDGVIYKAKRDVHSDEWGRVIVQVDEILTEIKND